MKRFIKCLCVVLAVACIIPISAVAADSVELAPVAATTTELEESVAPRADVIELKYRIYNGLLQVRRWNATWGYWVHPEWITVGTEVK